jgi:hypothetical protein
MTRIFFMGISTTIDGDGYIDLDLLYAYFATEGLVTEMHCPSCYMETDKIAKHLNQNQSMLNKSPVAGMFLKPPVKVVGDVYYAKSLIATHYVYWLESIGKQ